MSIDYQAIRKQRISTKDDLLSVMEQLGACCESKRAVREHPSNNANVIWSSPDDDDDCCYYCYRLWFMSRYAPKTLLRVCERAAAEVETAHVGYSDVNERLFYLRRELNYLRDSTSRMRDVPLSFSVGAGDVLYWASRCWITLGRNPMHRSSSRLYDPTLRTVRFSPKEV